MADHTRRFEGDALKYIQTVPFNCQWEGTNVRRVRVKIEKHDNYNFAQIVDAGTGGGHAINFHILGWQDDQAATGHLDSTADYFYTGPLSGCTFAVDKNWYKPHVLHVNYHNTTGGMDSVRMSNSVTNLMVNDTSKLSLSNAPNVTVVTSHNRNNTETYNIFGIRGYFGWTFYQQICTTTDDMAVVSVNQLDTAF